MHNWLDLGTLTLLPVDARVALILINEFSKN